MAHVTGGHYASHAPSDFPVVSGGQPCEAMSPHGYGDIEAEAVERITEWIVTTTTSQ